MQEEINIKRPVAIIHNAISNAQNNRSPRHSKTEEKENGSLRKHKTLSAILRHIENPCQTYDFFSNSRSALVSIKMQEKYTLFLRQT